MDPFSAMLESPEKAFAELLINGEGLFDPFRRPFRRPLNGTIGRGPFDSWLIGKLGDNSQRSVFLELDRIIRFRSSGTGQVFSRIAEGHSRFDFFQRSPVKGCRFRIQIEYGRGGFLGVRQSFRLR